MGLPIGAVTGPRDLRGLDFFENMLPEGPTLQRMAALAGVRPADTYGILKTFGRDCAGAIQVLPEGERPGAGGTSGYAGASRLGLVEAEGAGLLGVGVGGAEVPGRVTPVTVTVARVWVGQPVGVVVRVTVMVAVWPGAVRWSRGRRVIRVGLAGGVVGMVVSAVVRVWPVVSWASAWMVAVWLVAVPVVV